MEEKTEQYLFAEYKSLNARVFLVFRSVEKMFVGCVSSVDNTVPLLDYSKSLQNVSLKSLYTFLPPIY